MDGDARGGAALSIRQVTGQPIKFIGVGEKYDALEPFHPDRIVSRIMGMGDVATLLEKANEKIDQKKAQEFATKALMGDGFSLEDFRDQLRQVKKMGSLQNIMKMLPSVGPFAGMQKAADQVDEGQIGRVEAIINSMTQKSATPTRSSIGSRRKRIAGARARVCRKSISFSASTPRCARCSKTMAGQLRQKAGGHEISGDELRGRF